MTQVSDEERQVIVAQGQAARRLLGSPDYVMVINTLADETTLLMAETAVGKAGRADREQHHAVLVALHAVHAKTREMEANLAHLEDLDAAPEAPEDNNEEYE